MRCNSQLATWKYAEHSLTSRTRQKPLLSLYEFFACKQPSFLSWLCIIWFIMTSFCCLLLVWSIGARLCLPLCLSHWFFLDRKSIQIMNVQSMLSFVDKHLFLQSSFSFPNVIHDNSWWVTTASTSSCEPYITCCINWVMLNVVCINLIWLLFCCFKTRLVPIKVYIAI